MNHNLANVLQCAVVCVAVAAVIIVFTVVGLKVAQKNNEKVQKLASECIQNGGTWIESLPICVSNGAVVTPTP